MENSNNNLDLLPNKFRFINPTNYASVRIEALAVFESYFQDYIREDSGEWEFRGFELWTENDMLTVKNNLWSCASILKCHAATSYVWGKVESIFDQPYKGQMWLAMSIIESLRPLKYLASTKSETETNRGKIVSTLEKALELMGESSSTFHNDYATRSVNAVREYLLPLSHRHSISPEELLPVPPYEVLQILINEIKNTDYRQGFNGLHVHRDSSTRTFFIRSLSCAFLQRTQRPYRRVITDLTNAAFGCSLTEREIARYCNGLDHANEPAIPSESMSWALDDVSRLLFTGDYDEPLVD